MSKIEKINDTELTVKEYQQQRVVTFKDIDTVHGRPEGTAGRNFRKNKEHFIEGEDFFTVCPDEIRRNNIMDISDKVHQDIVFFTEQGYLMLVKSFTDDLAWDVQRQLVKSYFRKTQGHNVKQLTVTSRDVAVMANMKSKHAHVLSDIRECIEELEEMGFNPGEFFIESTYVTRVNNNAPQFLCTERGCERFSWRLEPETRKVFIKEFKDRFERMQSVLEGKPVKGIDIEPIDETETVIRLYKNNDWGILLMDNDVYNLTPEEVMSIVRFIPKMKDKGVNQIKSVITAFLESIDRNGKLQEVKSWGVEKEVPQTQEQQEKLLPAPKQEIDLNQVVNLTIKQAQQRYSMCREKIIKNAEIAGACLKDGNRNFYSREILDAYFKHNCY